MVVCDFNENESWEERIEKDNVPWNWVSFILGATFFLFFIFYILILFLLKEKKLRQNTHIKILPRLCNHTHCFKIKLLKMARDWTHWLALFLAGMTKDDFFSTFFRVITFKRQYFAIAILSSDSQVCLMIFASFMNTLSSTVPCEILELKIMDKTIGKEHGQTTVAAF